MGNFISLLNISEDNDNGYIPYTTTLTKYQDHTGNYQNFEQGQKYFFRYIITHNDTLQKVTKTYPIPFEIDSVLGVTDFNIRITPIVMSLRLLTITRVYVDVKLVKLPTGINPKLSDCSL